MLNQRQNGFLNLDADLWELYAIRLRYQYNFIPALSFISFSSFPHVIKFTLQGVYFYYRKIPTNTIHLDEMESCKVEVFTKFKVSKVVVHLYELVDVNLCAHWKQLES